MGNKQTRVLAAIQFDVSLSSSHFLIHFLSHLHWTGSCQFSPQLKLCKPTHTHNVSWNHLPEDTVSASSLW